MMSILSNDAAPLHNDGLTRRLFKTLSFSAGSNSPSTSTRSYSTSSTPTPCSPLTENLFQMEEGRRSSFSSPICTPSPNDYETFKAISLNLPSHRFSLYTSQSNSQYSSSTNSPSSRFLQSTSPHQQSTVSYTNNKLPSNSLPISYTNNNTPTNTFTTTTPNHVASTDVDAAVRTLESGHFFTLHTSNGFTTSQTRVVVFLSMQSRSLCICEHIPGQSRYSKAFLVVPLFHRVTIAIGPQSSDFSAIQTQLPTHFADRCFVLYGKPKRTSAGSSVIPIVAALEACSSTEMKNFLKLLHLVLESKMKLIIGKNLRYCENAYGNVESVSRTESRIRSGRTYGASCRKHQEFLRRYDACARLSEQHTNDESRWLDTFSDNPRDYDDSCRMSSASSCTTNLSLLSPRRAESTEVVDSMRFTSIPLSYSAPALLRLRTLQGSNMRSPRNSVIDSPESCSSNDSFVGSIPSSPQNQSSPSNLISPLSLPFTHEEHCRKSSHIPSTFTYETSYFNQNAFNMRVN